jgi:hypothetical protein
MKNKVKREAPLTKLKIRNLSAEEKDKILMNVRIALVGFHATLKASKHLADFIQYHKLMLNHKTVKLIKDAFVEQDYLCTILDKAFDESKDLDAQHIENQKEASYEILEAIEEKCKEYLETEMGFRIVKEIIE